MTLHPILVALALTDLIAALLVAAAAVTAVRVVLGWDPGSAARRQLELERRAEAASLRARAGLGFFLLGSALLVVAVTAVLPDLVPGAMCGTGVLQATGPLGPRALALRGLALAALAGWHLLDRLDRSHPRAPLTTGAARALLLATPILLLAVADTGRAFLTLGGQPPVDCCAVVYDAVRTGTEASARGEVPWVALMTFGAPPLLLLALLSGSRSPGKVTAALLAALALAWVPAAAMALVRELAAYHYGVLAHDCPFCLFAARHYLVGYPLFGALVVVALEGPAVWLARAVGDRAPELREAAAARSRRAALTAAGAAALFLALAWLPALVWRFRHGVWIG